MFQKISLASLLVISLLGCGGPSDGFNGARGQVTGKVTHLSNPVPAGTQIVFQSKDGPNYNATAEIGADGKYNLLYNGKSDIPAVTYLVTVLPPAKTGAATQMSPDMMANPGQIAAPAAKAALPFPARYGSAVDSRLEYTVKAGANTADFDLELN